MSSSAAMDNVPQTSNLSNLNKKTVGILGGGQLGRMMVQAASKLNVECFILDDTVDAPAKQLVISENGTKTKI